MLLHHFHFEAEFILVPLEVTPIKAQVTYTDPLAIARYQEELTGIFKASHEIKAGDFYVRWRKDLGVPKYSFYDFLFKSGPRPYPKDPKNEFKTNEELVWYKDPNSVFNFFKEYAPESPITKQIGEKIYYKVDLVNKGI